MTTQTKNEKAALSLRTVRNRVTAIVFSVAAVVFTSIGVRELDNGYLGYGILVMSVGLWFWALIFALED